MFKFTDEFKQRLWKACTGTKNYAQVFRDAGYDPEVPGESRICSVIHKVAQQWLSSCESLSESNRDKKSIEERLKKMEFEMRTVKRILQLTSRDTGAMAPR